MTTRIILLFMSITCVAGAAIAEKKIGFPSYQIFQEYCLKWASVRAVRELNISIARIELLHGKIDLTEKDPKEVIDGLSKKGWFKKTIHYRFEWDPVIIVKNRFKSSKYPDITADGSPEIDENPGIVSLPVEFIQNGLRQDAPFQVRWFVLENLARNKNTIYLEPVVDAMLQESEKDLLMNYINVLKTEPYVKESMKAKKPFKGMREKVKALIQRANTQEEKEQALFLSVVFTDIRPEVKMKTVYHSLEKGYCTKYFVRLFKTYPQSHVEHFTDFLMKGYGGRDVWQTLLRIFTHFTESGKCLGTLYVSLLHKNNAHYSWIRRDIIKAWEKMTGIQYTGDDRVFFEWFDKRLETLSIKEILEAHKAIIQGEHLLKGSFDQKKQRHKYPEREYQGQQ